MFVANTANDTIVKIPVTGSTLEPGTPEVFVNRVGGGPDGLIIDEHDNLWIACNQSNEILVLEPTQGRVIAKLGDFGGIDRDGAPIGFLWSNSLVFHGDDVLVTNLSLDFGAAIPQLSDELGLAHLRGPESADDRWTVGSPGEGPHDLENQEADTEHFEMTGQSRHGAATRHLEGRGTSEAAGGRPRPKAPQRSEGELTMAILIIAEHENGALRPATAATARRPRNRGDLRSPYGLAAFNFVLDDMLEGGVNASLGLDGHGKSLSFLLLAATVRLDAALLARLVDPTSGGPAAE